MVGAAGSWLGFHRYNRWEPQAFPTCSEVSGSINKWRGISYLLPEGWMTGEHGDRAYGRRELFLSRDTTYRNIYEGVQIAEDWDTEARETFEKETPFSSAVPGSVQRLSIDGKRAVIFRARKAWQHGEDESWELLIHDGDRIIHVGGPELDATPLKRRRAELPLLNCNFWAVVRSLKLT